MTCTFVCTVADSLNVYVPLSTERHAPRLPTSRKNGIKKPVLQEKWKKWEEVVEKFPTSSQEVSVTTTESLHSHDRGVALWISSSVFFEIYEPAMYTIQHNPARLYNCNEMGITTVQHKHTKILGLKGKGQISSVQSAERGSLVTVVTCLSPTGHIIPPLLVFPRKIMKEELMNGTPPGSIHACHSSGWIQSEIFTQ